MIKSLITTVGAAALGLASLITPAQAAPGTDGFSALEGVQAQALSTGEMDAIHGGAVSVAQVTAAYNLAMSRFASARSTASWTWAVNTLARPQASQASTTIANSTVAAPLGRLSGTWANVLTGLVDRRIVVR